MIRNFAVFCATVCLIGLPFLAGWICFSSFNAFAHNDDFLYARCSEILVEEGRYQHVTQHGKLAASVASHSVWGALICWPVGFSYDALLVSVGIAAWIGAVCVYFSARELGGNRPTAILSALALVVGPYYYGMSFTFMTDVTAAAFAAVAVLGYVKGITRSSLGWMLMGAVATSVATWARQTHLCVIMLPLVACAGIGWTTQTWKRFALPLVIAAGIPIASFVLFESTVPGNEDRLGIVNVDQHDWNWIRQIVLFAYGGGLLLGLAALPMLPLLGSGLVARFQQRQRWFLVPACFVLLAWGGMLAASRGRAYLTQATGYILYNAHLGPILLGDQNDPGRWSDMGDVRWPATVWLALTIGAIFTLAFIAGRAGETLAPLIRRSHSAHDQFPELARRWTRVGLLACFSSAVAGLLVYVEMVYDRYWILCYPMLFTWMGTLDRVGIVNVTAKVNTIGPSWRSAIASAVLVIFMFAISFTFVHDFLAWNHTRHAQVQRWLAEGLEPQDFDAGNGINGWFRSHEDVSTPLRPGDTAHFWRGLATTALSVGPRDGWSTEKKLKWYSWAVRRECDLYVIVKDSP